MLAINCRAACIKQVILTMLLSNYRTHHPGNAVDTRLFRRYLHPIRHPIPSKIRHTLTYILSTGVRPSSFIPLDSTTLALSYKPISATFFSGLSAYMTLMVFAFLLAVSLAS